MKKKNLNIKESVKRKNIITKDKSSKENTIIKEECDNKNKEKLKKDLISYLIIFFLSLVYFIRILPSDVLFDGHDLLFHSSNIITIASELTIKNLLPNRILPDLVNNLGYGVNIFYPNLPHVIGAYFYKIINNIPLTFKLLYLILINLSGITMYKLIDKIFKNKQQALMSAITYISMPYFFSDFFIRCAFNESFLFFIMPLILLGIHYLIDDNNKFMFYLLFVLGYVLAINSHLVMSVYLTIILVIYLLVQRKKVFKKEVIKNFVIASIFILLLTSHFTIPLLEHNHLGIYNILNIDYNGPHRVQVANSFNYLLPIKHLDIPMYIQPLMSFVLLYIFINISKIDKKHKSTIIGIYIILIISLFLATNQTIWQFMPNIIKNIQFAWRMSLFIVLSVSILFGCIINLLKEENRKTCLMIFIIVFAVTNFISSQLIKKFIPGPPEILDKTEEHQWGQEYLPIESVYNLPEIKAKKLSLSNYEMDATIKITKNEVPNMEFVVKNLDKELTLEFPRIYYLGYKLTDNTGKSYKLTRNYAGFLSATINKSGTYKLEYTGTTLSKTADLVTIISYILFLSYLVYLKYNKKRGANNGNKQKSTRLRNSLQSKMGSK